MVSAEFDPFASRLARDIRNSLSRAFLKALKIRDASPVRRCAAQFLDQGVDPVHADYIQTRLRKYAEVFAVMDHQQPGNVLQLAAILWDRELYFEMHELLEPAWKRAEGDRRRALQGLIRAAGMKVHARSNNMKAASNMGAKAEADLMRHGDALAGFTGLDAVLAEIRQTVAAARSEQPD